MKLINSMYFKILLITFSAFIIYYTNYEYNVIIKSKELNNQINNKLSYIFEAKNEKFEIKTIEKIFNDENEPFNCHLEMIVNFKFYNIYIENQKIFTKNFPYLENNVIYLKTLKVNPSFVEDEEFKSKVKFNLSSKINKISSVINEKYKDKINKKIEEKLKTEKEEIVLKVENILKINEIILYSSNNFIYEIKDFKIIKNNDEIELEVSYKLKTLFIIISFSIILFFTIFYKRTFLKAKKLLNSL